mmetsp:Transcript_18167/g.28246  ORF Transcript_18167/g.28246 Transcript_18167/m.28246 type:complete len:226 (-) Transcript_18167:579-1256(-)
MVASVTNPRTTVMISGHSTSKAEHGQKFIRSDTLQTTTIVRLGKDGVSVFSGPQMKQENSFIILFGGHRLWHGFASDNSFENNWESDRIYPKGGYLDDMWIFSNDLTEDPNKTGTWSHQEPKDSYEVAPGVAWESRNDVSCQIYWPSGRAEVRGNMRWLWHLSVCPALHWRRLQHEGLQRQVQLQWLLQCRISCIKVYLQPGILWRCLSVHRVPQQLHTPRQRRM